MTLKAVTKLAILLVALAALALPLTGTPVSAAQGNTVGKPTINGILRVGETLTADTSGISDPDGIIGRFSYQWYRHDPWITQFTGGTASTYTLVDTDLGWNIDVRVGYFDNSFASENVRSSRVGPVLPAFDDRATLMALYDSAGGANWLTNTNWNTSAALDTWYGVETDTDGRVTGLELRENNLVGQIPDELGDISELEYLDLRSNYLNGQIPSSLGNLNQLTFLSLHTNHLTGPIPEALGNLKNLEFVRFAGNSLTECVPEGLNYLLTAPDYNNDPAHDFIGVDANGDGDYDDADDTPGLGLLFCGVGELAALELSGVALNPAFTSRRETYTATVPYDVVSTTVTAELNLAEDAFTIKKDGNIYTSGDAVPLIAGSSSPNVITIEVAVADSAITKTYTVVVTRKDRARERITVPSNWSLIPDGFGPGEQFRLLFATSETRNAASSSIADYDAFVREQAAQGHASIRSRSSKFRAVGSTAGFGARGHTGTTDAGVPIYYLNGEKIADNYNDFYDGSWDSVETRDENGGVLTSVIVWTGTQSDGTCSSNCLGSQFTITGQPEFQDDGLYGGIRYSGLAGRFYALSPIFMVGGLPQATLKDSFKPPGSSLNGIWSDGTTIWVVDDEFHDDVPDTVRAYRKSDQTRDDEKDITGRTMEAAGNVKSRGIWSDGTTMWVADSREDKIFAYDKTTRQRDASKDFYTLRAAGNNEPSGIWSDGTTMWVADPSDNKIYAYRMSDKSRDPDKDFDILSDNHDPRANQFIRADKTRTWLDNTNPHGIWSDGATMWVTNTLIVSTDRIYAYRMSDWSRDGARDLILPNHDADARKDNKFPGHIWSDGTDLYVSDGYSDRIFVYSLPQGSSAQQQSALRAPGQPQKLAVNTRGVDEMTLNWDPPDSDGGSAITSYTVAYEPDDSSSKSTRRISRSHIESHESHTDTPPGSAQVTTTGTSFTVTGLTGGTEYSFRVIATNDVGDGPPSEEVLGTPLEPPPLEAEFPPSSFSSQSHTGADDWPQVIVAFSRAVSSFAASTPSVSVTGGMVSSVSAHEEEGLEHTWMFFLDPEGAGAIEFSLVADQPCSAGGICTEDGATLSVVPPAHTIPGPEPVVENSPATGGPTISGAPQVGETLTVGTSGIADEDGLDNVTFNYQWTANDVNGDADLLGATGSSYPIGVADVGKTIRVRVTFIDDQGNEETLTSAATTAVTATVPDAPGLLDVSHHDNGALDAYWETPSSDGGSAITGYKVQWKETAGSWDVPADVTETTVRGTTCTITGLTDGVEYTVRVITTNDIGDGPPSDEATGTPGETTPKPNTPATGAPTISGTAQVGKTLTVDTSGIDDADGLGGAVFSYQWIANDENGDVDISGATGASHDMVAGDKGKAIKVRVTFTDDDGNEETLTSEATAAVAAAPTPLTAWFKDETETHSGSTDAFTFRIAFSEAIAISYQTFRDHSLEVTGGSATKAKRVDGRSDLWEVTVEPDSNTDVAIVLAADRACDVEGAVCTKEGKRLSNRLELTVAFATEPPMEPPPAPTNLTARVNEDGSITLNWEAPDDESVTGYQALRRRPTEGEDTLLVYVADTNSTATAYTDTNVTAGIRHVYRVKAINAAGLSQWSNYARATP